MLLQARMVMRSKGQLRLLMNANLWPDMKITPMDGGKVRSCPNLPGAWCTEMLLQIQCTADACYQPCASTRATTSEPHCALAATCRA